MQAMRKVIDCIRASHDRVGRPSRLLIALSGGADSLALAHALVALRDDLRLRLHAAHIHHGLRQASDEDEAFVREFCQREGLPFSVKRLSLEKGSNMEARARAARYAALDSLRLDTDSQMIALGHHQDDQAETVLMRLLSGSSASGLAAMRELSGLLWRPLLTIGRADIRAALLEAGLRWRDDDSNRDEAYRRNALRLQVMPRLEAIVPGAATSMARTAGILQDEETYWQKYVEEWLYTHASTRPPNCFLMAKECLDLPLAARRRVLRGLCGAVGIRTEFAHVERLLSLLSGPANGIDNLPNDARALRSRDRLHFLPASMAQASPGRLERLEDEPLVQPKQALIQALDADAIAGAEVRFRQQGDRISPLGAGGSKPLSEYFTDCHVDRPFRDHWPLLARGSEVLWVVGIGISQMAAMTRDSKRTQLVAYRGSLPSWLNHEYMEESNSYAAT